MLSYDLHTHSCLSPCADDDMTPGNILGMASLIGLDVIALTDHNTCKNCPSLLTQAQDFSITVLPGMELTTSEEVHVLCYFHSLKDAMAFDAYVEKHLLPLPNQPDLFGNQLLCDNKDNICGTYETLLISATDISFFQLGDLLKDYHGIMIPAHIDKKTNSLISQLGFIPEGCSFPCFELHDIARLNDYKEKYPSLTNCQMLCSSDAHQLTQLHEREYFISNEMYALFFAHSLFIPAPDHFHK